MNTDWLPAAALSSLSFLSKSHWWDARLTLVSIIPVNANANLLFGTLGKVAGRSGGRSGGCRVGCVQKEPSYYGFGGWSNFTQIAIFLRWIATEEISLLRNNKKKAFLSLPVAWQLLSRLISEWWILKKCVAARKTSLASFIENLFHSVNLYPSAEQVTQVKYKPRKKKIEFLFEGQGVSFWILWR